MIHRIISLVALPDFKLAVTFVDGKRVLYDVESDFSLPGYMALSNDAELFRSAQLDQSRTCVYWTDEVDLPSDAIYEYGREVV